MSAVSRCHDCGHAGRHRRRVNARKRSCDCACHLAPVPPPVAPVRGHHRWPAYVTADIEFEVAP